MTQNETGAADVGPVLDATFPRSLKRRARNIVLRERADDTNTQDNYDHLAQPIRCPVDSPPTRGRQASFKSAGSADQSHEDG
jgi:hypothetical protein